MRMPNTITAKVALYALYARWKEKGEKIHDEGQWQERLKKGICHGTIWRSRRRTRFSGGQWLRPYAPIGAMRTN